jgi:hypothetical protein
MDALQTIRFDFLESFYASQNFLSNARDSKETPFQKKSKWKHLENDISSNCLLVESKDFEPNIF